MHLLRSAKAGIYHVEHLTAAWKSRDGTVKTQTFEDYDQLCSHIRRMTKPLTLVELQFEAAKRCPWFTT